MTKMQLLKKIGEVDDKILSFVYDKKPKLDPLKLKKVELERLLDAFETMDELLRKCSDKENNIFEKMTAEEQTQLWMYMIFNRDKILEKTEEWTKEAEKAGMTLTEYLESINPLNKKEQEFHCGVEESGGHAYNCNDCPNKCEEWHQWDKEFKEKGDKDD